MAEKPVDFTYLTSRIQKAVESATNVLLDAGTWKIVYKNGKRYEFAEADELLQGIEGLLKAASAKNEQVQDNGGKLKIGVSYGDFWGGLEVETSFDSAIDGVRKVINEEVDEGKLEEENVDSAFENSVTLLADEFTKEFNLSSEARLSKLAYEVVEIAQIDKENIVYRYLSDEAKKAVDSMLKKPRYNIGAFIDNVLGATADDMVAGEVLDEYEKELDPIVAWYDDFMMDSTEAAAAYWDIRTLGESPYGDSSNEGALMNEGWKRAKDYLLRKIAEEVSRRH